MGLFDFIKKNNSSSAEVSVRTNKEDEESKVKLGAGIALDASVQDSIAQAEIKYSRPEYNPQTRKIFYDDGNAHKAAIERAFSSGETVRDPYTGAVLVKKQSDAKIRFGKDWQKHAAEADHIDPLSQISKRTKKNPFLTADDIRKIGNSDDNFQVLSRKLNQTGKEVGKGGSTQAEWAEDPARMQGLANNIESDETIEIVSKRISDRGKAAERRNNELAIKKSIKNVAGTAHEAGKAGAINAGITAVTMSVGMNMYSVIKGEKSGEEAVADIIKDGGKAAVTGYAVGGGLTVISQILAKSDSEFIKELVEANVPGKVITAVLVTGDTLKKWGSGEITTQECLIQLGDKGLNMATMGYAMAAGQALIPIPIVGGAVGALVGSVLTSSLYNELVRKLQTKQLEHQERIRITEECKAAAEQARAFRKELEAYLDSYFQECRACFDEAMSSMQLAYQIGDADGVIAGANQITRKLGGTVQYETVEEFKSFLESDAPFVL